jgi:hypothetical protein
MARKRYTVPETVLRRVIEGLEDEDLAKNRAAIELLLTEGPLDATETLRREREQPETFPLDEGVILEVDLVRAELLALLRQIVRLRDSTDRGYGITLQGPTRLFAQAVGHDVHFAPEGRTRDVVILQLVLLVQAVGLRNVRKCEATDCARLYVKTYRREFCSSRCQKRTQMRAYRHEQEQQAHARRARQRRRLQRSQ